MIGERSDSASGRSSALLDLYAEYLQDSGTGTGAAFERFCERHPERASDLRRLHEEWRDVEGLLDRLGVLGSLGQRLTSRYGAVDPAISLDGPGTLPIDAEGASKLLAEIDARGSTFGRYDVRSEIGRGGQGAVLHVWDKDLRRNLALKLLLRSRPGEKEEAAGTRALVRFLEEAQVTSQLDHPGIVPVHEIGLDSTGRVYFTMKLVQGQSLQTIVDRPGVGGWTTTRVVGVLQRVCEAVSYAHAKRVVHRDLKPSNVMVGRYGEVYVMDWGLARVGDRPSDKDLQPRVSESSVRTLRKDDADSPPVTVDGEVIGTPAYMSPEQARGGAVGQGSDVYSIGGMLYHAICGRMPYADPEGKSNKPHQVLRRLLEGALVPVTRLAPDAPPELVAICERAMATRSEHRYPRVDALGDDLRSFLEGRVVRAYETGPWAELRKWVERNRGLAAAIAALFLALVAGVVTSTLFARQSRARADQVLRASTVPRLESLIAEASELWPAHPANAGRYQDWIDRAEEFLAEPVTRELVELSTLSPGARGTLSTPGAWSQDHVRRFAMSLPTLADPATGLLTDGITPGHGWGVRKRLAFAASLESRSITGAEAAARWSEAIASIGDRARCPQYDGLLISPQLGLLPLGQDPGSGLWEFAHLQTGRAAVRDARGQLSPGEEDGLVFVLLPESTFSMGAENDPAAQGDESPRHDVTLTPFFLSKFELTQGQWTRIAGQNQSYYNAERYSSSTNAAGHGHSLRLPMELVSWIECVRLLSWMDLTLPSEAQWEYAARAGTSTPWSTGESADSLDGSANVADMFAKEHSPSWEAEPWNDGYFLSSPVGTFRPNAFGLHDMHGNVWEWCYDWYQPDYYAVSPSTDPICTDTTYRSHVVRGGSFSEPGFLQRVSYRNNNTEHATDHGVGFRPARRLVLAVE